MFNPLSLSQDRIISMILFASPVRASSTLAKDLYVSALEFFWTTFDEPWL
jgi:hypothetical protein